MMNVAIQGRRQRIMTPACRDVCSICEEGKVLSNGERIVPALQVEKGTGAAWRAKIARALNDLHGDVA